MSTTYQVGFDWLTTTWNAGLEDTPMSDKKGMVKWLNTGYQSAGATNLLKSWAWNGYHGWSFGGCSWGERYDGTILRLSSFMADAWLHSGKPTGHNCSRIDISCTIWGCLAIDADIARHNDQALEYRKRLHSRPFQVRHIVTSGDGDTLYLGARSSNKFVRIYNKEKEQGNDDKYATAIRYECEFKEGAANQVLERYRSSGHSRRLCAGFLLGALQDRGIVMPLDFGIDGTYVAPTPSSRGDIEASLAWLEEQVAPTIRRLIDAGRYDDIIKALGLDKRKEERNGEDTNRD